ncbi:MAG: preprotein translocase subunit SecG [Lysobacteraceae bacterium]|uniref:preprotein translocase subunit SecG n=1 Tax=Denitratimonas sp. CY0512 TaxID=3131940 RepID=UPI0030A063DD
MIYTLFNVVYVLVAVAMTVFILLQRGAGAGAGAGFGAGASATVFGARGSANFLSKSTAILATIFFLMALGMAVFLHKTVGSGSSQADELGIMGSMVPEASVPAQQSVPAIPETIVPPAAPAAEQAPAAIPAESEVETPVPATE